MRSRSDPTTNLVSETPADGVRLIRLNRPDRLNALDFPLVAELHDALDDVAADDACKVAILTGAGRGFCAGLDLTDWGSVPGVGAHPRMVAGRTGQAFLADLVTHIRSTPQIMVAAINGPAFGGGLALALACDLRIAGSSATLCSAFIRTGLTGTDVGVTYLLPRLIGAAQAFDLIVTGRSIDSEEAHRMGIVSRVIEDQDLLRAAKELAQQVAGYTSFGLRNTKEVMWLNLEASSLEAALALENRNQDLANRDEEVRAYMASYSDRHKKEG